MFSGDNVFSFWFAAVVFAGTYIAIASEKVHKTTAALAGASLMLIFILPGSRHNDMDPGKTSEYHSEESAAAVAAQGGIHGSATDHKELGSFSRYVNFNVIFTLAGMMILVNILSGTGLFQYVAIRSAKFARGSPVRTMVLLVISSAVLSAFLDNVTTILLLIPITMLVASQLEVNPIPFLMAETFAANIGGTATLIGDPPNLIIGTVARLDFLAFIVNLAPFIIFLVAAYSFFLSKYYGKKMPATVEKRAKIMEMDENGAISDIPTLKRAGAVMILTLIGFLLHGIAGIEPSIVAMSGAALALAVCGSSVEEMLEKVEWATIFFFLGLFIVVNGAEHAGIIAKIGNLLGMISSWHPLLIILIVMWVSALFAALMNCVSYTAATTAIITGFFAGASSPFTGNPELQNLMWWGLSLSVCLGANASMVGAAANMVTVGLAEKSGQQISFRKFAAYGVPVTFCLLLASSAYISLRYWIFQH